MVAEKVRVLLERKRTDVISAIAQHDVGYHLDKHSRHPVVYEYFADLDVIEGASRVRAQGAGGPRPGREGFLEEARLASGIQVPHGHPITILPCRRWGYPVYLDETPILNLADRPYWYCGVLNLNGANRNFVKFDYTFEDPAGIVILKKTVQGSTRPAPSGRGDDQLSLPPPHSDQQGVLGCGQLCPWDEQDEGRVCAPTSSARGGDDTRLEGFR